MDKSSVSTYDVSFNNASLGITFVENDDGSTVIVDGFYQEDGKLFEAEMSMQIALNDRIIAVQGKSVAGLDFSAVMGLLHTKKRPLRITFERSEQKVVTDNNWEDVLFDKRFSSLYLSFLQRKNMYLCTVWLLYIMDMEHLSSTHGKEKEEFLNYLLGTYIQPQGMYSSLMSAFSSKVTWTQDITEIEFCFHKIKVDLKERLYTLSWNCFVYSPEYQFTRLDMKHVLYNRHTANIFLSFLLTRETYKELALWMEIHYELYNRIKQTDYPESIDAIIEYCLLHPIVNNDDNDHIESIRQLARVLDGCQEFVQLEHVLETLAVGYMGTVEIEKGTPAKKIISESVVEELSASMIESIAPDPFAAIDNTNPSLANDELDRRLSTSSVTSVDEERNRCSQYRYSENEMGSLLAELNVIISGFFKHHSISIFPDYYYHVMEALSNQITSYPFLDPQSLSLLHYLLECIQIRLFQFILDSYYADFVCTDLFEYLVSEQRLPSSPSLSSRLLRESRYMVDRLKDCEEEIPYLRRFIQEYSENAIEILNETATDNPAAVEAALKSVRGGSSGEKSFRPVDLEDIIRYIHRHRTFSVHQRVSQTSSHHLKSFQNQPIFKVIYYQGDEATRSIHETASITIDSFQDTGLSPPGDPISFFLPEGYHSFSSPHAPRIFPFLLGSSSAERWSAVSLTVYFPSSQDESVVYVPEGLVVLSPFNNLPKLHDRLLSFLATSYQELHDAPNESKKRILQLLLKKDVNGQEKRRFSAAVFNVADGSASPEIKPRGYLNSPSLVAKERSTSPIPSLSLSDTNRQLPSGTDLSRQQPPNDSNRLRRSLPSLLANEPHSQRAIEPITLSPDMSEASLFYSHRRMRSGDMNRTKPRQGLRSLFSILSIHHVLLIQRLLLLEHSVLCLSSQFSLLTTTMESLKELLRPFVWQFTYCPILPLAVKKLINNPMPYFMGTHSSFVTDADIQRLHGVTIVNLDLDTVTLPEELKDYHDVYRSALTGGSTVPIPKEQRESILPPLPMIPEHDLLREVNILHSSFD